MKKDRLKTTIGASCSWLRMTAVSILLTQFSAQADVIVPTAEADLTIRKIKASHFLTQATMGPRVDEIDALANRIGQIGEIAAFNEWLDDQFSKPNISKFEQAKEMLVADGIVNSDGTADTDARGSEYPQLVLGVNNYYQYSWWHQAIHGDDQLRQRMAWALSQIFIANTNNTRTKWNRNVRYYDMLQSHAFGNYRNLIEDVTYNPVMGEFLSHLKNDKGDESLGIFPDENFAREIMQLFSIGVYQTNPAGRPITLNGEYVENYSNEDIKGLAKVFTGLSHDPRNPVTMDFYSALPSTYSDPMIMHEDHHHTGEKSFLGHTLPAGQAGDQDISDALDILFNFETTPQFIAHRLIQRFTCSTPHTHYVFAVAKKFQDNGYGVRGDFKEVIREVLMNTAVRDNLVIGQTALSGGNTLITVDLNRSQAKYGVLQGRLREPVLQMAHFIRFFEPDSDENETGSFAGYLKPDRLSIRGTEQGIAEQISVFGYYSADFLPTSGPAANRTRSGNTFALPEFESLPDFLIPLTEGVKTMALNGHVIQNATTSSTDAPLVNLRNYSDIDEVQDSFEWLVSQLNIYMFHGTMDEQLQADLIAALDGLTDGNQETRFANALSVLMNSADFAVSN
ncbi:DUF1800 family protein [Rubritalea spongiae]|uniref:DUF1800 family protein n=1 Tax=Rubritalea spongiae TaxID=430797 RepID=A0ABW5DYI5_9BACT